MNSNNNFESNRSNRSGKIRRSSSEFYKSRKKKKKKNKHKQKENWFDISYDSSQSD